MLNGDVVWCLQMSHGLHSLSQITQMAGLWASSHMVLDSAFIK